LAADAPLVDPIAIKLRAAKRAPEPQPIGRGPTLDLGGLIAERAEGSAMAGALQVAAGNERQRKIEREMRKTEQLEARQRGND
jgi:hypothetical protein